MNHCATALCVGIFVTALVGGIACTPTSAKAATTSSADKAALKEATAACKAEAKEKKIGWPASRRYVSDCVAKAVKLTPEELQAAGTFQSRLLPLGPIALLSIPSKNSL